MTSGRQSADRLRDGDRALELPTHGRPPAARRRRARPRRSSRRRRPGTCSWIASRDRVERDDAGERGEAAEQHRVRHRPPEVLARDARSPAIGRRCGSGLGSSRPSSSSVRELFSSTRPPPWRPAKRSTWCSSVGSWTISASGSAIGSRLRIGRSSMRQNATTGAPVRSEPKVGNACACLPSANAATESSSAAVTTPWPPRPWMRTWNTCQRATAPASGHPEKPRGPRGRAARLTATAADRAGAPSVSPTRANASSANSSWSSSCAAEICTRTRAVPSGTTGIAEAGDEHAPLEQQLAEADRERRVADDDGDDRRLAGQRVEAALVEAGAEVAVLLAEPLRGAPGCSPSELRAPGARSRRRSAAARSRRAGAASAARAVRRRPRSRRRSRRRRRRAPCRACR